jgi:hypothetical protein
MAKIKVVVEGDSWERLPSIGLKSLPIVGGSNYDLGRGLEDLGYDVTNLAQWGDTIQNIVDTKEYLPALKSTEAPFLLVGGGGNDLLGGGRLQTFLHDYSPGATAKGLIKPQFYVELDKVISNYKIVLHDVFQDSKTRNVRIIVHGYDYARPMRLGWLGNPMAAMGINDIDHADLQDGIVKLLIDAFNMQLKGLEAAHDNIVYVDFRNMVGDRWHDELHPEKAAFADLSKYMAKKALK